MNQALTSSNAVSAFFLLSSLSDHSLIVARNFLNANPVSRGTPEALDGARRRVRADSIQATLRWLCHTTHMIDGKFSPICAKEQGDPTSR